MQQTARDTRRYLLLIGGAVASCVLAAVALYDQPRDWLASVVTAIPRGCTTDGYTSIPAVLALILALVLLILALRLPAPNKVLRVLALTMTVIVSVSVLIGASLVAAVILDRLPGSCG